MLITNYFLIKIKVSVFFKVTVLCISKLVKSFWWKWNQIGFYLHFFNYFVLNHKNDPNNRNLEVFVKIIDAIFVQFNNKF